MSRRLDVAYQDKCFLSMRALSTALEIDPRTLKRHVDAGRIVPMVFGAGIKRPRRRFTREQVEFFLVGCVRAPTLAPSVEELAAIRRQAAMKARRSIMLRKETER